MRTLHSQKLFFQHFINIFHCWTIIPSQNTSSLSHFLSIPLMTQQKEEAIADKSAQLPIGFPFHPPAICAGCCSAAYACRQYHRGHTPLSATCVCCCDCHSPVLLLFAFTCPSAGTASSPRNWRHTAELPALHMPLSSGKLETHPPGCTKWFTKHRFQDLRSNMLYFEWLVYSQEIPLIQDYQIKRFHKKK